MQFFLQLHLRIANHIQKYTVMPQNRIKISCIYADHTGWNRLQYRFSFLILFVQLIFFTVHIIRQLYPRAMSKPVQHSILNHKGTL